MNFNLSKRTLSRLDNYPQLKLAVNKFIKCDGYEGSGLLTDLTVYIRKLEVDEPSLFDWSYFDSEDFYSWGHNSRYAHVLEPMLYHNLNRHVCKLLNYLEDYNIKEPVLDCVEEVD